MTRKNIKIPEPLFNALRDDKDDTQSWPHYLESECLHDDETAAVNVGDVTLEASERRAIAQEVAGVLENMGGR